MYGNYYTMAISIIYINMTTLMIQLMFKPSKHLKTDETQYCQRLYNAFSKKTSTPVCVKRPN